ncbi:hypothetical protein FPQ18DRAFT_313659 [Pyronema domesticum]|nr:hypothetical protein FPQ18DRAFT_313659 [Pyronema domesticum]
MLRTTISKNFFYGRVPAAFYSQGSGSMGSGSRTGTGSSTQSKTHPNTASKTSDVRPSQAAAHLGRMESVEKNEKHMSKSEQEDAALRAKLEEHVAGDGGASGVEYENGNPADVKRAVRENMFRVI